MRRSPTGSTRPGCPLRPGRHRQIRAVTIQPPAQNKLTGDADAVVQAGAVHGGINLYGQPQRSLPPPRQLPRDATRFVNREGALARLDSFIPEAETGKSKPHAWSATVAAIAGAPGVGKTALAVHWGHRARHWFPDGDLYVDMRAYGPGPPLTVDDVLGTFLRALHVPAEQIPIGAEARAALYRSTLQGKRILILVDNVSAASQVRHLFPATPSCVAIVTSRSRMSGLVVRDGAERMTLDLLSPEESADLLADIIGSARVEAEPQAVAELAGHCAYLPLALRIIAERIANAPHVPLSQFVADLTAVENQLDLLSIDDELADVRAAFSWSYQALSDETARCFRLLGLHAGGHFCTAAAAALIGRTLAQARALLDTLAGAHLIQDAGRDRYQLHDLLRAYAAERTSAEDSPEERRRARRRLYCWYLQKTEAGRKIILPYGYTVPLAQAESGVDVEPPASLDEAMAWFESERLTIVAILREAEQLGEYDLAWQLPVVASGFFELKSYWSDWRDAHLVGLRAGRAARDRYGEAATLLCLGDAYYRMSCLEEALDSYERGVAASREVGDAWLEGFSLRGCGLVQEERESIGAAAEHHHQALRVFRAHGITRGAAMALLSLGNCSRPAADSDTAVAYYEQALSILHEIDDQWSVAWVEHALGLVHGQEGRFTEAEEHHRRALPVFQRFGDRRSEAATLVALGETLQATGDITEARRCWQDALGILESLRDPKAATVQSLLG